MTARPTEDQIDTAIHRAAWPRARAAEIEAVDRRLVITRIYMILPCQDVQRAKMGLGNARAAGKRKPLNLRADHMLIHRWR
jgi:hypothetical protein